VFPVYFPPFFLGDTVYLFLHFRNIGISLQQKKVCRRQK
jgi:hypothetical protein